ncbi:MAG: hypothetical protein P8R31_04205 [Mariniblastus sp.]|nr:hypothetical protein [Mariniblastus sp.]
MILQLLKKLRTTLRKHPQANLTDAVHSHQTTGTPFYHSPSAKRRFSKSTSPFLHPASTLGVSVAMACILPSQVATAQQFQKPVLPGETAQSTTELGMMPSNRLRNTAYPQAPRALAAPTTTTQPAAAAAIPTTDFASRDISKTQTDSRQVSYNTFAPPVHIQPTATTTAPVQVQYRKFSDQTELPTSNNIATPPRRAAVDSIYNAPIQSLKNSVNKGRSTPQRMLIAKSVASPRASRTEVQRRRPSTATPPEPQRENAITKFQNQITNFLYTPAVPSQRTNNRTSFNSRSGYSPPTKQSNGRSAGRRKATSNATPPQTRRVSSMQPERATDPGVQYAYSNENSSNSPTSVQNAVQQVTMVEPTQDPFNDESVELPPAERIIVEQTLGRFNPKQESAAAFQQPESSQPKPDPSTMSQISVLNRGSNSDSSASPIVIQNNQDLGGFKKPTQDPAIEELPAPNSDFDFGTSQRPSISSLQNCDDFRAELLDGSIKDIALDLSPLPGRNRSLYQTEARDWIDRDGNVVATGTMIDLRRGYVIIESALGTEKIPYAKLSDPDWATISQFWQLPELCSAGNQGSAARNWSPQTYAWQASALCHKPLYFENVQLERYGHTHGPLRQPIHSVAHFFVSLVTVPYQTGIHPVNECQYALGFYRPGDCAPWLKDPIPFSLNGAVRQALVTTGVAVIP